jgi:hypothetical protein
MQFRTTPVLIAFAALILIGASTVLLWPESPVGEESVAPALRDTYAEAEFDWIIPEPK